LHNVLRNNIAIELNVDEGIILDCLLAHVMRIASTVSVVLLSWCLQPRHILYWQSPAQNNLVDNAAFLKAALNVMPGKTPGGRVLTRAFHELDRLNNMKLSGSACRVYVEGVISVPSTENMTLCLQSYCVPRHKAVALSNRWARVEAEKLRALLQYVRKLRRKNGVGARQAPQCLEHWNVSQAR
jgi:hypothetical protein